MGYLWDIAQAHLDAYGVRAAALARRMGTSPQTLDSWKNRGVRSLPTRELLEALARETRTPYPVVLDAALRDIDYLPKAGEDGGDTAPNTVAPLTAGQWDELAEDLRRRGLSERTIVTQLGVRPVDAQPGEVHPIAPGDVAGHTAKPRRAQQGA